MEDSGTIAAWAALAAALLALVVALAQASQQYVATAHSMRKCEKSVWGPMPGHPGRRVWVWRQLRFRVVFDLPNIFIPSEYWPEQGNTRQFPASRVTSLPAPFDRLATGTAQTADPEMAEVRNFSEAGWVAFSRHVSYVCPSSVKVGLQRGDIDRLPADLAVVPMQVSLRDVIVLGLAMGMTVVTQGNDSIDMSGPSGVIKSSDHPFLGKLLHFTAFSMAPKLSIKNLLTGKLSHSWMLRLHNTATIAMQEYDEPKRRYYELMGMRWRSHRTQLPTRHWSDSDGDSVDQLQIAFVDTEGNSHNVPIEECETWEIKLGDYISTNPDAGNPPEAPGNTVPPPEAPTKPVEGKVDVEMQGKQGMTELNAASIPTRTSAPASTEDGEDDNSGFQTNKTIPKSTTSMAIVRRRRLSREGKSKSRPLSTLLEQAPESDVSEHEAPHIRSRPYVRYVKSDPSDVPGPEAPRVVHRSRSPVFRLNSSDSDSDLGMHSSYYRRAAFDTQEYWNLKREDAYVNRHTRYYAPNPPILSFFWAAQLDVELGPWATPWARGLYTDCREALSMLTEIALAGLRHTALKARGKRSDVSLVDKEIRYVSLSDSVLLKDLWVHLRQGRHTWPPYATNARTGFATTELEHGNAEITDFGAFGNKLSLPPLWLLESVRSEALHDKGHVGAAAASVPRDRLLELASIDYWLWQASEKVPALFESSTDGANVLTNAPAMVEEVWLVFGDDIMHRWRKQYDRGQGDAHVTTMARDIGKHFGKLLHTPAERYFAWVALLRAAKTMECIKGGPETYDITDMLQSDQLVYLL
ncbi:unnamed protein product [Clonostachys solani]|uniref:Uncharacterized protein n=1 Tax=Clonostachys solani TaxID=160281 RepID=A0A9N9Z9X7_9HYPO|nr:unnamed protein product [Clonostachys solani]